MQAFFNLFLDNKNKHSKIEHLYKLLYFFMGIGESFHAGYEYTQEEATMKHHRDLLEKEISLRADIGVGPADGTHETIRKADRELPGKLRRIGRGCRRVLTDLFSPKEETA